jgi:acylphosphatase
MEGKNVRAHVLVFGKVQGVFYRAWVLRQAQDLRLVGWVRNAEDGKVEAVFEGEKEKVEEMIEKCKEGSKYSKVKKVNVAIEKATGKFESFEIV